MGDKIMWASPRIPSASGCTDNAEYSYRLITEKKRAVRSRSHLTTYLPFLDTIVKATASTDGALLPARMGAPP